MHISAYEENVYDVRIYYNIRILYTSVYPQQKFSVSHTHSSFPHLNTHIEREREREREILLELHHGKEKVCKS